MKNYFVLLEFLNKVTAIKNEDDLEHSFSGESMMPYIKNLKSLNMDIDGIQKQVQEYETALEGINETTQVRKSKNLNASEEGSLKPCSNANCEAAIDNQYLSEKIDHLEQK